MARVDGERVEAAEAGGEAREEEETGEEEEHPGQSQV